MDKKEKGKKTPVGKKKAAHKPLKENPNHYEDFHKVLNKMFTPVVFPAGKQ